MGGRIMLAATASASGKTTITCGLLQCLLNRNLRPVSFKCGPDYIDPLFHQEILGVASRNLDLFLSGEEAVVQLLAQNSLNGDVAVIEGVMGFYDGQSGQGTFASSYHLAQVTKTPVVLVLNCRGMALSIAAQLKGYLTFRADHGIVGVILNQISPAYYEEIKAIIAQELALPVLGYVPRLPEIALESRHLGLVTAAEVADLRAKIDRLAQVMAETVDLDGLLALAAQAPTLEGTAKDWGEPCAVRLAVARDRAFCFYYQDNLDYLHRRGAELVFFSPLSDTELPADVDGLYLGGGYPEVFAEKLAVREVMRRSIQNAVLNGLPTIAECGGFLYLHEQLEDEDGCLWAMAGVLDGKCFRTDKLNRFGYVQLMAEKAGLLGAAGASYRAHEFHYWNSENVGSDFLAEKSSGRQWRTGYHGENLYAGFPHLHFWGNEEAAENFLQAAQRFREQRKAAKK